MRGLFFGGPYNSNTKSLPLNSRGEPRPYLEYAYMDPVPVKWPPPDNPEYPMYETRTYRALRFARWKEPKQHPALLVAIYVDQSIDDEEAYKQFGALWPTSPDYFVDGFDLDQLSVGTHMPLIIAMSTRKRKG